jgi:hypothetical protein
MYRQGWDDTIVSQLGETFVISGRQWLVEKPFVPRLYFT